MSRWCYVCNEERPPWGECNEEPAHKRCQNMPVPESIGERIARQLVDEDCISSNPATQRAVAAAIDEAVDVPAHNYAMMKQAHDKMRAKRDAERQRAEQAGRERDEALTGYRDLLKTQAPVEARLARLTEAARNVTDDGVILAFAPGNEESVSGEKLDALRAALDGEGQVATNSSQISSSEPAPADDRTLPSSSKIAPVGSDVRSGQMPENAPMPDICPADDCGANIEERQESPCFRDDCPYTATADDDVCQSASDRQTSSDDEARALWRAYQAAQGSADHTARECFEEVVGLALAAVRRETEQRVLSDESTADLIMRTEMRVRREEREACAALCDDMQRRWWRDDDDDSQTASSSAGSCAAAIRARDKGGAS